MIRLNVPLIFINLANEDNTSSSCSTLPRYGEPAKLFVILSTLIRCFDVSAFCKSQQSDKEILPNPFYTHEHSPICVIPQAIAEIIYKKEIFLKKIIEDSSTCEDSLRLLRFLLWENAEITSTVLNEIMTLVFQQQKSINRISLLIYYFLLAFNVSYLRFSCTSRRSLYDSNN